MTRNKALALVALAAIGCGCGRTSLLPLADDVTKNDATKNDASPGPDVAPALPDVGQEDTRPPEPDGPTILPDVWRAPDTVEVRPLPADAVPDTLPPPFDTRLDLLLPPPPDATLDLVPRPIDMKLDLLPPPIDLRPDLSPDLLLAPVDLRPDLLPPAPDLRPSTPDTSPPIQVCASGEACSSDCKTTCQVIGTSTCICTNGTLSCGTCQTPRLVFTPTPCPVNAAGTACDTTGVACPLYANGTVAGLCACLDLGAGTRWNCL